MRLPPAYNAIYISFLIILISTISCGDRKEVTIRTETINVKSLDQIELITHKLVKPLLYTSLPDLKKLPVRKAKAKFISAVLPAILIARHIIEQRKFKIEHLRKKDNWSSVDSSFYVGMKKRYRANNISDLILRMGSLPTSIVLAQAAVESGWGKSRIFLKANNLFGVWSFTVNEPRVAAGKRRKSKTIYLRSYPDMAQSVVDYFEILARSASYRSLRIARSKTADPFQLLPHLINYSERRNRYTRELKRVMIKNNFVKFDRYQIDPQYLEEHSE